MNRDAINLDHELRKLINLAFLGAPVEPIGPIGCQVLQPVPLHAVTAILVPEVRRPACGLDPRNHCREFCLRNIHLKWTEVCK